MDARDIDFTDRVAEVTASGETHVGIDVGGVRLNGDLVLPRGPRGVVLFAHGSGSSRLSPRNRFVATTLNRAGFATLLLDLLTPGEETDRANVFDIRLLGDRLIAAALWLRGHAGAGALRPCLFGASTGAGAALYAAAELGETVAAVVSRGGRPDLAGHWLGRVLSPTLLIVGGNDPVVRELNERALELLAVEKRLVVVPGAGHLFEEPGALEQVAALARDWLLDHVRVPVANAERQ